MPDLAAFPPDPDRARWLDRRARARLADSLEQVFDVCRDLIPDAAAAALLCAAVRAHPVAPAVFALYTALVEALLAEDASLARHLLDSLLAPVLHAPARRRVITLRDADLGPGLAEAYARLIDDDAQMPLSLGPVSDPELARVRALFASTLYLLEQAAPALAGEIEALAPEAVMVANRRPDSEFGGASTFYLWGALVLNASRQTTRVGLAESLAHEAGHAFLLGVTLGAPLVENDPTERHASPLRHDPRPMDGIVHASFVLARMVWCQNALLASGLLTESERAATHQARTSNIGRFTRSEDLILTSARFTAEGAPIWHAARTWMAELG